MMLSEQHRPRTWDALIGQEKAVKRVRRIIERDGWDGGAFWIAGPSGLGKTSAAWIIARTIADDFDILELDGESCGVDAVREARALMDYSTLSGRGRAWIVNEAQAMSAKAVQAWLTALDPVPARTVVVFTTTADSADLFGEYDGPFRSRCTSVPFTNQGLARPFAERAREIADAAGLNGKPIEAYVKLVQACRNNMRAVLAEIEAGAMIDE